MLPSAQLQLQQLAQTGRRWSARQIANLLQGQTKNFEQTDFVQLEELLGAIATPAGRGTPRRDQPVVLIDPEGSYRREMHCKV
jgi:hypothetical protein